MKKKIVLPFDDHPYSLIYHGSAFPMGIIQGNATHDITPWLSSKYINCWFNESATNKFAYYISDHWPTGDKILFQQKIDLFPDHFELIFKDLIMLFRKMLNMGYYPHGRYNEEYIPGKWSYQKQYYAHDFILIGYDDIKQCFISVGYLQDGHFQRYNIPYENMYHALNSLNSPKISYNFWLYNSEAEYNFNLSRLLFELSDYLQSTTSMKIYSQNRVWGVNAIEQLGRHFLNSCNGEKSIDVRYTRGLMEHKFYMKLRMEYLLKNDLIKDLTYLEDAKKVYKMSEAVHLLGLKYNYTKKLLIIENINDIIKNMLAIEKVYLSFVLDDLK